jgi:hypothetical protein
MAGLLYESRGVRSILEEQMGRPGHSITSVDEQSLTGDCSVCCCRVEVKSRGARGGYYCAVRLQETERARSPKRKEEKQAWWAENGHRYPTRDARYYRTADGKVSFKLTNESRDELLRGKTCAVCGGTDRLVIDHCHESGKLRGVLCNNCNLALGLVRDSIGTLLKMVEYLQA